MKKIVTYNSVGKFIADASKNADPSKSSHRQGGPFHGTETFDEAVALATHGWPEGVSRLQALRAELDHVVEKALTARAARLAWDVTGDFIDIGRVLTGEPESCGAFHDADDSQTTTRVIKLVANVSAMGSVGAESIFSAGAAIYAAVDLLEALGHRVELWLGSGSRRDGNTLEAYVLAKPAAVHFDPDRLAFFLCHNSSLRRLFFSVEQDRGFDPGFSGTYPLTPEEGTIITPEVGPFDHTVERRIGRLLEVCQSCGVSFSDEERREIVS